MDGNISFSHNDVFLVALHLLQTPGRRGFSAYYSSGIVGIKVAEITLEPMNLMDAEKYITKQAPVRL